MSFHDHPADACDFIFYYGYMFSWNGFYRFMTYFIAAGVDLIRGWGRKGTNVQPEGYGTAAVLPEQGIYLAASVYRPVLQV